MTYFSLTFKFTLVPIQSKNMKVSHFIPLSWIFSQPNEGQLRFVGSLVGFITLMRRTVEWAVSEIWGDGYY